MTALCLTVGLFFFTLNLSRASPASSSIIPIVEQLTQNILTHHQNCHHLDFVLSDTANTSPNSPSHSTNLFNDLVQDFVNPSTRQVEFSTHVIINDIYAINPLGRPLCVLIITTIFSSCSNQFFPGFSPISEPTQTITYPVVETQSFTLYLLLTDNPSTVESTTIDLNTLCLPSPLLNHMRVTENAAFQMIPSESREKLYRRVDGSPWILETNFPPSLNKASPNWAGKPLAFLGCQPCKERANNYFEKTGKWSDDVIITVYHVISRLNATLEFDSALAVIQDNMDENGQYDAFTQPQVEGTVIINQFSKPSVGKVKAVYTCHPIYIERGTFLTALPKITKYTSLGVLKTPIGREVWLGVLASIALLSYVLRLIFCLDGERKEGARENLSAVSETEFMIMTFIGVTKPLVEQAGFNKIISVKVMQRGVARIMLSHWYLMLIVLVSGYKSKLIEFVSIPKFVSPPTDMDELIQSNYEFGAILYTGVLEEYVQGDHPWGNALKARVVEYAALDPNCYMQLFEGENVCLGPETILLYFGMEYMVDVNGDNMFQKSKQSYFPTPMSTTVSKLWPGVLGHLNYIIDAFHSSGLYSHFRSNLYDMYKMDGKEYAQKAVLTKNYYKGSDGSHSSGQEGRQVMWLSNLLLCYGSVLGTTCFILEYLGFRAGKLIERLQVECDS